MFSRCRYWGLLFLVLLGAGCPGVQMNPWTSQRSVDVDGAPRTYYVHPGSAYDGTWPVPLLIVLHPFLGSAAQMEALTGFSLIADRDYFVVAYPEGIGRRWNSDIAAVDGVDDVGFIDAVIDDVGREFTIDMERIYVVGASNGAFMTYRLMCELGWRFAAAGVVMGTMPVDVCEACMPAKAIPLMMIHGTADPVVPFLGGQAGPDEGGMFTFNSFFDTMWYWVGQNGLWPCLFETCALPDLEPEDGTCVTEWVFREGEAPVHALMVTDGGHTWPGSNKEYSFLRGKTNQDINASELIWSFLRECPSPTMGD